MPVFNSVLTESVRRLRRSALWKALRATGLLVKVDGMNAIEFAGLHLVSLCFLRYPLLSAGHARARPRNFAQEPEHTQPSSAVALIRPGVDTSRGGPLATGYSTTLRQLHRTLPLAHRRHGHSRRHTDLARPATACCLLRV